MTIHDEEIHSNLAFNRNSLQDVQLMSKKIIKRMNQIFSRKTFKIEYHSSRFWTIHLQY